MEGGGGGVRKGFFDFVQKLGWRAIIPSLEAASKDLQKLQAFCLYTFVYLIE